MGTNVRLIDPATGEAYRAGGGGGTGAASDQVQGNAASGATDLGNPVKFGGVYRATQPTLTDGQRVDAQTDTRGNIRVVISGDSVTGAAITPNNADTRSAGNIGVVASTYPYAFNGVAWDRQRAGPRLTSRITSSAASVNATSARAGLTFLYKVSGQNTNAAARYLKVYDKATAPVVGTDTPLWTIYLPPSSGFDINFPVPMNLPLGLAYAITVGAADADATAVAAGDILALNLGYSA